MATDGEAVFKALADRTRRTILSLLRDEGLPVQEIARRFAMSRPAVSKHLRLLREVGLVDEVRQGRMRIYALVQERLEPVEVWLSEITSVEAARSLGPQPAGEPGRLVESGRGRGDAGEEPGEDWRMW